MTTVKRTRARRLAPEDRKRQLTDCAIKVFADQGIGRASHGQVAKLANVAVPTVFLYFPSRESLIDAVLSEVEALIFGILKEQQRNTELSAFEKIQNILLNYTAALESQSDLIKIFLDWNSSFDSYLSAKMENFLDRDTSVLAEIIEEGIRKGELDSGVDSTDAALMIYSSATMLAQMKRFYRKRNLSDFVAKMIATVLHVTDVELISQSINVGDAR